FRRSIAPPGSRSTRRRRRSFRARHRFSSSSRAPAPYSRLSSILPAEPRAGAHLEKPMKKLLAALSIAVSAFLASGAGAQQPLNVKPLAEKKVAELPPGALFWGIESFASLVDAQAAAGPLSLAVESRGKAWLFTLGGADESGKGTKVTQVGPISRPTAPQYLLRINEATDTPGSVTTIHTHPGSEAFYVLAGEQTIRSPHGVMRVAVGQPEAGHGADMPMQVSSTGTGDLHSLVMF